SRAALESYLPGLQETMERALASWSQQGELSWIDELRRLSVAGIAHIILGLQGGELETLMNDYIAVLAGFGAIPVALPGTALQKAQRAQARLMEFFRAQIAARRREPTGDGLSRILEAKADGVGLEDEAAALELHHIFLAGYIVFAMIAGMLLQLE